MTAKEHVIDVCGGIAVTATLDDRVVMFFLFILSFIFLYLYLIMSNGHKVTQLLSLRSFTKCFKTL